MSEPQSEDPVFSVTGYVIELGSVYMDTMRGDRKVQGVVLECGEREVRIDGLDKAECKALAKLMSQEVIVRITPVTKP
jgi:hypothetical protein